MVVLAVPACDGMSTHRRPTRSRLSSTAHGAHPAHSASPPPPPAAPLLGLDIDAVSEGAIGVRLHERRALQQRRHDPRRHPGCRRLFRSEHRRAGTQLGAGADVCDDGNLAVTGVSPAGPWTVATAAEGREWSTSGGMLAYAEVVMADDVDAR